MKKYICVNCGFRSSIKTETALTENGVKLHRCKNCGCIVFTSKKSFGIYDETWHNE